MSVAIDHSWGIICCRVKLIGILPLLNVKKGTGKNLSNCSVVHKLNNDNCIYI